MPEEDAARCPPERRKRPILRTASVSELNVRWLVFSTGEKFRVTLWPPEVATTTSVPVFERDLRDEQPRLLVFEGDGWSGSVPVRKSRLADFSREELLRLYRVARQRSDED